jgi:hypothetical protein
MPGYLASVQCQESNKPICTLEAGVHSAEHNHVYICTSLHSYSHRQNGAGILEQSMGARNRFVGPGSRATMDFYSPIRYTRHQFHGQRRRAK